MNGKLAFPYFREIERKTGKSSPYPESIGLISLNIVELRYRERLLSRVKKKIITKMRFHLLTMFLTTTRTGSMDKTRIFRKALSTLSRDDAVRRMKEEANAEVRMIKQYYREVSSGHIRAKPTIWTSKDEVSSFLKDIDAVLFDCDGVLYRSPDPAPGAKECILRLLAEGKSIFFVTNNASSNRTQLKDKLHKILELEGVLNDEMMVSASYSVAMYLKQEIIHKQGRGRLYVIGSEGLCEELRSSGFTVLGGPSTDKASMSREELAEYPFEEHPVDAVVVGHDTEFTFRKMCIANVLLQMNPDSPLIATNEDSFDLVGVDARHIPGNGSVVRALEHSSGKKAICTGKPNKVLADLIISKYGISPSRSLMIGDRLDTDIQFAHRAGMHSLLVMTGVTTSDSLKQLGDGTPEEPLPSFICSHVGLLAN